MYIVVLYGIEIARTDDRVRAEEIYWDCRAHRGMLDAEMYEETKEGVRRVY